MSEIHSNQPTNHPMDLVGCVNIIPFVYVPTFFTNAQNSLKNAKFIMTNQSTDQQTDGQVGLWF